MSNAFKKLNLWMSSTLFMVFTVTGCDMRHSQMLPGAMESVNKPATMNCIALKREQLYNKSNMNLETSDTTLEQQLALKTLIAQNCR